MLHPTHLALASLVLASWRWVVWSCARQTRSPASGQPHLYGEHCTHFTCSMEVTWSRHSTFMPKHSATRMTRTKHVSVCVCTHRPSTCAGLVTVDCTATQAESTADLRCHCLLTDTFGCSHLERRALITLNSCCVSSKEIFFLRTQLSTSTAHCTPAVPTLNRPAHITHCTVLCRSRPSD